MIGFDIDSFFRFSVGILRTTITISFLLASIGLSVAFLEGCSRNTSAASPETSDSDTNQTSGALSRSGVAQRPGGKNSKKSNWTPPAPLDADRSYEYLKTICDLGPRVTSSPAMLRQQKLLKEHFESLGGIVLMQDFTMRHPVAGTPVQGSNIIVRWKPELRTRVMLCTHYDTRMYADEDLRNPKGKFIGANDGGSGTAMLMELAHAMKDLPLQVGVDFVLFDAEEFMFKDRGQQFGDFFVGSDFFAQQYVADQTTPRYRAAILVDMIGDAELKIYQEVNSWKLAKNLVTEVWDIAKQLKISEFEHRLLHEVRDDHLGLNNIAGIPAIDLIDFDYPRPHPQRRGYWHTTEDTVDKCSGESITKVAAVLLQWMKQQK